MVDLTPLEFLDRLAAFIPPPRKRPHRHHGVFAPSHPLRPAVPLIGFSNIVSQLSVMPHAQTSTTATTPPGEQSVGTTAFRYRMSCWLLSGYYALFSQKR